MRATIQDYGIMMSKENKPLIFIKFACEDKKDRTWFGPLNEGKAREITLDSLLRCGLKGNDVEGLAAGKNSGLLDLSRELELSVAEETYNGKTREKIKWINAVGGQGFKSAMGKEDAVKVFSGMNLKADLAARRLLHPDSSDDIPF